MRDDLAGIWRVRDAVVENTLTPGRTGATRCGSS
jgi:hypothetical protein